ncbi:bifunctional NAD(P)/FAD-dependent oxidoreductase/class I SAM-dependent methyltransferase [Streptomyces camponoticapitis]|uniref:bifunctional NAD(P)/FAD-dependent oxidoreductase/class I SAM-dependent methyltransferase n=1 Tax=Streptomyces camponoticapitis TaxID=1616125 RepID=UPI00166C66BE|nr:bifunctional NAD(P)/FAD-dependent oxidoreductase/class I SAM-dependent methyltransferase [Streptomyces camponoticapitis]
MKVQKVDFEVVVIGGGAAGLSAGLTLARARRSVLVIDSGEPRNAPASHVHGYLGREGIAPAELLAVGREEVAGYGGEFMRGRVTAVKGSVADGFRLVLEEGAAVAEVTASRLLVTTGLADELPAVPGVAERWGRDVLHCPYCHGWEVRDAPIGILATGPLSVHQAQMWRQWSDDVTLFRHTAPEFDDEQYEQLAARGIAVVDGEVTALEVTDDRLSGVTLADGRVVPVRAVVVPPLLTARGGVLADLGAVAVDREMAGQVVGSAVPTDPAGATSVPGVWAAGNVADPTENVIGSAAAGVRAAAAINAHLIAEETRRAVEARQGVRERAGEGDASMDHGRTSPDNGTDGGTSEEFWDSRYAESARVWSGNPNTVLVREAADLTPGRALDLGCGEGADAIWLAGRGWRVTACDISGVALAKARRHAEAADAGVAGRIDWQRHDFGTSFPTGTYDLVSAQFLHSPDDMPREKILRAAASAVAPGGVLLIVGHAGLPSWEPDPDIDVHLPTPDEVLASLELADEDWEVLLSEEHERIQTRPDGQPGTRTDNALKVRRRAV